MANLQDLMNFKNKLKLIKILYRKAIIRLMAEFSFGQIKTRRKGIIPLKF